MVAVSRLAHELKLEGLLTAIDCVADLARSRPFRLLIVGSGPARDEVDRRAAEANRRLGRQAIQLTGELVDPRPAYALGDIQLAMGSSAIRAMAFGKPVVVQGEQGFWETLSPDTADQFLWTGFYGVGPSADSGPAKLRSILTELADDRERLAQLGSFGHQLAEERFGLDSAAHRHLAVDHHALDRRGRGDFWRDLPRTTAGFAVYTLRRRASRWAGRARSDDFNAAPVAADRSTTDPSTVTAEAVR